jgi:hypothetical protein
MPFLRRIAERGFSPRFRLDNGFSLRYRFLAAMAETTTHTRESVSVIGGNGWQ